jgi:hypothetical protein
MLVMVTSPIVSCFILPIPDYLPDCLTENLSEGGAIR